MKLLKKNLDGTGVQVVTIAGVGGPTADERTLIKAYSMDTMTNLDDQSGDRFARFGVTSQVTYLAPHRDSTVDTVTQATLANPEMVAKQLAA